MKILLDHPQYGRTLGSACYNFRLPFDEQLLIYAQRPDAKAVLSFNSWNNRFNRMVNRGAKGIAVVDDSTDNPRLKYYFDISDTSEQKTQNLCLFGNMRMALKMM